MDKRLEQFERDITERDGGKSQVNRGQAREIRKVVADLLNEGGMDLVRMLMDDSNNRKAAKMNKQVTDSKGNKTYVDNDKIAALNTQPVNTVDRKQPPEIASSTTEPIPAEGEEARQAAAGQFQQPPPINEQLKADGHGIREDIPADNVEAGTEAHSAALKAQEQKAEQEANADESTEKKSEGSAPSNKMAAGPATNKADHSTKGHSKSETTKASKNAAAKPLAGKGKHK